MASANPPSIGYEQPMTQQMMMPSREDLEMAGNTIQLSILPGSTSKGENVLSRNQVDNFNSKI